MRAIRLLDSAWIIDAASDRSTNGIEQYLKPFIGTDDRLLVVQFVRWASVNAMDDIFG